MKRHVKSLVTCPIFFALICLPAFGSADRQNQGGYYQDDRDDSGMMSDQKNGNIHQNDPANQNRKMGQQQPDNSGYPTPTGQGTYSRADWNNPNMQTGQGAYSRTDSNNPNMQTGPTTYSRADWNYPNTHSRAGDYQMNFNQDMRNQPSFAQQGWDSNRNTQRNYQGWYARGQDLNHNGIPDNQESYSTSENSRYFPGNSYYSSGFDTNHDGFISPRERMGRGAYSSYYSPRSSGYSYGYSNPYSSSYGYSNPSNYSSGYYPSNYYSGYSSYPSNDSYGSYPYSQYYNSGSGMEDGIYFNVR